LKIKASVLRGEGQECRVEEVELLPPRRGEVLVRVAAAGVGPWDGQVRRGEARSP
jgi:Zn-dependent alcohol dehydrogenase